jgi:hypothetical protein
MIAFYARYVDTFPDMYITVYPVQTTPTRGNLPGSVTQPVYLLVPAVYTCSYYFMFGNTPGKLFRGSTQYYVRDYHTGKVYPIAEITVIL